MTHFCVTLLDLSTTSEPNLQTEFPKSESARKKMKSFKEYFSPEDVSCEDFCHLTFCSCLTQPEREEILLMREKEEFTLPDVIDKCAIAAPSVH